MTDINQVVERFVCGDPIAGTQALYELLALGDAAEEALFSQSIEPPKTVQVRRRWLRYVASREKTVAGRLIDRMQNQDRFNDAREAAFLFAGIGENREARDALYAQLEKSFHDRRPTGDTYLNYSQVSMRFLALGYAGGDAGMLWYWVSGSSFAWEKMATFAFRAACASFGRMNASNFWAIEQLITHQWLDNHFVTIGDSPDAEISNEAISSGELWGEANYTFVTWRRGEVADKILDRCMSRHAHWRVREFGAQVLASLGFQRIVTPVIEWLRREPVQAVRISLLHALARSETVSGADALIEHFNSYNEEGRYHVAKAAWRASDKNLALTALKAIGSKEDTASAEAIVSMARLGHRHEDLTKMVDSHEPYCRLNAALALGYLSDKSALDRLVAMQGEVASPFERIYLAAALAMLGKPNGAMELNTELAAVANEKDYERRVDLFSVHRYLQAAVLDGLATGGEQTRDVLKAWQAEMQSLDPIPQPVALAVSKPAPFSLPEKAMGGPLNVFISYCHADQKMRKKLGQHLAPLVDEGLIRIWHDRNIEAGADWEGEINKEIGEADIILLLVSASFIDSQYCKKELMSAIEQRSVGKSVPIPILLRPCDWTGVFNRRDFKAQALPRDDRSVAGGSWKNHDLAFAEITKELRAKIKTLLSAK
jgi:TIR domain